MNSVCLIGRITRDIELKTTNNGMSYAKFNLAVDRALSREKKEEAMANGYPTADFISIVVWGKQAENCEKYTQKGSQIGIQGRIQTGSYDKNGVTIFTTEIVADRIEFLSKINNNNSKITNSENEFFYDVDLEKETIPFEDI